MNNVHKIYKVILMTNLEFDDFQVTTNIKKNSWQIAHVSEQHSKLVNMVKWKYNPIFFYNMIRDRK